MVEKDLNSDAELDSEQEPEWSLNNIEWVESIRTSLRGHQKEISDATATVQSILEEKIYQDFLGHEFNGFDILGYDEPIGTWIVRPNLKEKVDLQEIARLNALVAERIGQIMSGRGEQAYYFVFGSPQEITPEE